MTLSIEVLPAPFGPMMARISPLRMSKETSTSARTPPNANDTRSTESSTSPAATSRAAGALMCDPLRSGIRESAGLLWLPPPLRGRSARAPRAQAGRGVKNRRRESTPLPIPPSQGGRGADAARPAPNANASGVWLSCGLLQVAGRRRARLHVADRHAGADHALAAVLEGDLGGNVGLLRAVVERLDERRIALGDEAAPHLLGTGQLAVIRVELLVQHQEAPDLRPGHDLL